MITQEQFELIRKDLIETYKDDLCVDSLEEINRVKNIDEFIRLTHVFAIFLNRKNIPTIDWVRKWFGNELELVNKNGVYIDQTTCIKHPLESTYLCGDCNVNYVIDTPNVFHVICQDNTRINIIAMNHAILHVRMKDDSKEKIMYNDKSAKIRIKRI